MTNEQVELSKYITEMLGECWHEWKPGKLRHRCTREDILSWQCEKCDCAAANEIKTFSNEGATNLNMPPPGIYYATDLNAAMRVFHLFTTGEATGSNILTHSKKSTSGYDLMVQIFGQRKEYGNSSTVHGNREDNDLARLICMVIKKYSEDNPDYWPLLKETNNAPNLI